MAETFVEYMPLSELMTRRSQGNPKDHDIGQIWASINRFGFTVPPTIDERDGTVVAGYGRLETLQMMLDRDESPPERVREIEGGDWSVPVIRGIRFNSDAEARAYRIADNRMTELGGWNQELLLNELAELQRLDVLDATGFDDDDLNRLRDDVTEPLPEPGNAESNEFELTWGVVVECSGEEDQMGLLEEMSGRGYRVRAIM